MILSSPSTKHIQTSPPPITESTPSRMATTVPDILNGGSASLPTGSLIDGSSQDTKIMEATLPDGISVEDLERLAKNLGFKLVTSYNNGPVDAAATIMTAADFRYMETMKLKDMEAAELWNASNVKLPRPRAAEALQLNAWTYYDELNVDCYDSFYVFPFTDDYFGDDGTDDITTLKTLVRLTKIPDPAHTLLGLPREIRDIILEELLFSPLMNDVHSTRRSDATGDKTDLNLHPAILRACSQLRSEGEMILYGKHKFHIECSTLSSFKCPITRYTNTNGCNGFPTLENALGIHKVQHWVVLTSTYSRLPTIMDVPTRGLTQFCRTIFSLYPNNLPRIDFLVIPKGLEASPLNMGTYVELSRLLVPIKLGRGFPPGSISIRDATVSEVPDKLRHANLPMTLISQTQGQHKLLSTTIELMEGDSPVELVPAMYDHLLAYAQTFETHEPFKDMVPQNSMLNHWAGQGYPRDRADLLPQIENPYLGDEIHPVERALKAAYITSETDDCAEFKIQRAIVVGYLEAQFKRMISTRRALSNFVVNQRRRFQLFSFAREGGFYQHDEHGHRVRLSEFRWHLESYAEDIPYALIHLQEYAESFKRHAPFNIRVQIFLQQPQFDKFYATSVVGRSLAETSDAYTMKDYVKFMRCFGVTAELLDVQLAHIIEARKDLFKADFGLHGCDVTKLPAGFWGFWEWKWFTKRIDELVENNGDEI